MRACAVLQLTGDPIGSRQSALQALANVRDQQAASLACFDCFRVLAVGAALLAMLVPFMKRAVAEKGAHLEEE